MRVTLRPTIAADVAALIPQPLPHRIQAITALAGERVIGIGGLGFRHDGTVIAFVAMTEEAKRFPVAIHRAGLMAMQMIRDSRAPIVVAEAQPGNPAAARWLERLGFQPLTLKGETVYVWEAATAHVE